MSDQPEQTSWPGVLLGVGLGVLTLLLVLAGTLWFILAEEGVAPPPDVAAEHATRVVRTGGAGLDEARDTIAGDRLLVDVIDRHGEPVPDAVLVLRDGRTGPERRVQTGPHGEIDLRDLPVSVWWEVEAEPPWAVFAPSILRPTVDAVAQTLVLQRTCGGSVRVLGADGAPFVGRIRDPEAGWLELDPDGMAVLPGRPCGPARVRVGEPRSHDDRILGAVEIDARGDEMVEVVMDDARSAILQVVDAEGQPVAAGVRPGRALGSGRVALRGWSDRVSVRVQREGQHPLRAEIPLDGAVHELVAPADREVALTLLCDQCPDALTCRPPRSIAAQNTCTGTPPDLVCICPGGDAVVSGRSASALADTAYDQQPLGRIPAGEHSWTLDVRGDRAALEATWTGRVPCSVRLERDGMRASGDHRCMSDGSVLASDLVPGTWTLHIEDVTDAAVEYTLELESGETRVLGEIGPEDAQTLPRDTGG